MFAPHGGDICKTIESNWKNVSLFVVAHHIFNTRQKFEMMSLKLCPSKVKVVVV